MEDFKLAFEKLKSKNAYKDIEKETIKYFFGKNASELASGTRLNHSESSPYIKKRIGGRGGFRFYYLLLIKGESLILMYVHPRTGVYGSDNITDESKAKLYKDVLHCIESQDFYQLTLSENSDKIIFSKPLV